MIATYFSALAVVAASLLIGGAALRLCGYREWSWLAPAVGLALLLVICWATVELPGEGLISAMVTLAIALGGAAFMRGRVPGLRAAATRGAPVAALALFAASLPFAVEGHFGILGTGFNPDMSQHLLAATRLSDGLTPQLSLQGYPLGPHAVVVALGQGLGAGPVQAFSGLAIAVPVLASLTALGLFRDARRLPSTVAALLVGMPYMVISYFAQGAFKETIVALGILAFALGLRQIALDARPERDEALLTAVPLAVIAAGAVYAYSFPGLAWLAGTLVGWVVFELVVGDGDHSRGRLRRALGPAGIGFLVFVILVSPEIGRMVDFRDFETFDPAGAGVGNLFGQISPAEALGIWPSGDFRLTPGEGAIPALGFYFGAALALGLLALGLIRALRQRESALIAALGAAAGIYVIARATGTPYQAAKAIGVGAPLAMAVILLPLAGSHLSLGGLRSVRGALAGAAGAAFVLLAAGCSLLALANAPVGPTSYSSSLTELRPFLGRDPTLVVAPDVLLAEEHGEPYLAWELRGGRICIAPASETGGPPPPGVRYVITEGGERGDPPFAGLRYMQPAGPYVLWQRPGRSRAPSSCPLIAVRSARRGPASD